MLDEIRKLVPPGFEWSVGEWLGGWTLSIWEPNVKNDIRVCPTCKAVKNISEQPKFRKGCYVKGNSLEEVIQLAKEKLGVNGV